MDVILSTRNPTKIAQIQQIFADSPIRLLSLDDVKIGGEAVEDGQTLEENALKKARFAHGQMKLAPWVMADDTGFFINHLRGEPGVKAARWAGEDAATDEITAHTLNMLKSAHDRRGTFRTVVVVITPESQVHYFSGEVHGTILEKRRVPSQPKMPYSGIFIPDGTTKVWAEMSVEEENSISHRGIAFRSARKFLEEKMW